MRGQRSRAMASAAPRFDRCKPGLATLELACIDKLRHAFDSRCILGRAEIAWNLNRGSVPAISEPERELCLRVTALNKFIEEFPRRPRRYPCSISGTSCVDRENPLNRTEARVRPDALADTPDDVVVDPRGLGDSLVPDALSRQFQYVVTRWLRRDYPSTPIALIRASSRVFGAGDAAQRTSAPR